MWFSVSLKEISSIEVMFCCSYIEFVFIFGTKSIIQFMDLAESGIKPGVVYSYLFYLLLSLYAVVVM